jgi:hypothetical protein
MASVQILRIMLVRHLGGGRHDEISEILLAQDDTNP